MKSVLWPLLSALLLLAACVNADQQPEKPAALAPPTVAAPASQVAPDTTAVVPEPVAAPAPVVSAAEKAHADTVNLLNALIQSRYPKLNVVGFEVGDINADGRPDMIVVGSEADEEHVEYRTTFLVLNEGYPKLRLAAVNTSAVCNSNDGGWGVGDPFRNIVIKDNYFSFEHLLGGTERTYNIVTFHYDHTRRDWLLHRIDETNYNIREVVSKTTRTRKDFGRVRFADYVRVL